MKPLETIFRSDKKYAVVTALCFIYGGFLIASFALQAYSLFWRTEIAGFPTETNGFPFIDGSGASPNPSQDFNESAADRNIGLRRFQREPAAALLAPTPLSWLGGGLISIFAGFAIMSLTRKKEIKRIKHETASNLLLPDEKKIIDLLRKSNYESTQARIAKETGLSKVQVHRAVKRLEAKGALEKHEYGLTNKIILNKELFE
ncbi:MAG: winged helix-turn-helix transcriptional regulator [Candidatus Diapherotrites archaeon]|nr:winged helix-turn-helix transcriptional regulator [Candidatus Diapherotrites archaeon]